MRCFSGVFSVRPRRLIFRLTRLGPSRPLFIFCHGCAFLHSGGGSAIGKSNIITSAVVIPDDITRVMLPAWYGL